MGIDLTGLGDRIRASRSTRSMTLAALASATGISVSTLSRLESGRRRASLELLVPVTRALGVSLDELVGTAVAVPDPRVRRSPMIRGDQVVVPLSAPGASPQAYHHTVAPGHRPVDLRTHPGHEWIYVLQGRLRLALGTTEITMGPGEAAEFDTTVPHWVGNVGRGAARFLSLFGPEGERVHLRTGSRAPSRRKSG